MAAVDFPANPVTNDRFVSGDLTYVFNGQGWIVLPIAPGGVVEAPVDGTTYGRKDAAWSQLTPTGGTSIEPGTTMVFWQAAAPTGWTKITTQNDKALRVVSASGGTFGGTNGFSTVMAQTRIGMTTLSLNQGPNHQHELWNAGTVYSGLNVPPGSSYGHPYNDVTASGHAGQSHQHDHGITMSMQYIDVILASKN